MNTTALRVTGGARTTRPLCNARPTGKTRRALLRGAACAILLVAALDAHAQVTAMEVFVGEALLATEQQLPLSDKNTCLTTFTQGQAAPNHPTTSCMASFVSGAVNSISVRLKLQPFSRISSVTGAGLAFEGIDLAATTETRAAYIIRGLRSGDNTITFTATDDLGGATTDYTLVVNRIAPELTSLTISSGALSPDFSKNTFSYNAQVLLATEKLTVQAEFSGSFTATAGIAGATAAAITSGADSGEITLAAVESIIEIIVGSSVEKATYHIVVTRAGLAFDSEQADVWLYGGMDVSLTLPAATADGSANYTYALTELPAGLSFDEIARTISGRPTATQATTAAMTYSATGPNGLESSLEFTIRVAVAPAFASPPPAILILPRDAAASTTMPALNGGHAPRAYELAGGVLPAGLTFSAATRILSGTPSKIADTTLIYTAKDAAGTAGTAGGIITANLRIRVLAFDLNVDLSGGISVQDGIMVARYLLGVRGASLSDGQSSGDAAMIGRNIQDGIDLGALDVDADGGVTGNDGILIARYLLGLRGEALVAGMQGAVAATVAENVQALM